MKGTVGQGGITPGDLPRRLQLWLDRLPPFPVILNRLLATLSLDPDDISLPHMADLVETDALIAGRVIGIANSSFYSRGQPVCSVRQAVIRLGLDRLRNVLLTISINRVFGGLVVRDGFSILRFNRHALATAILSDLLAQRLRVQGTEAAFIAGLFHDVGELVLVCLFPDQYMPVLEEPLEGEELEVRERELFTVSHAEMSAQATSHWNLPQIVQTAIRFHERAEASEETGGQQKFSLSDILHAADRCASAFGMKVFDGPSKDSAVDDALSPLRVKEADIADDFLRQLAVFDHSDGRAQRIDLAGRLAG